jgi:hypothetical protein
MDTILASPKEESRRTFYSGEKQVWDTHRDFSCHLRKWLHQYRIIVGKETPKTYGLTQGNPLPPIQMPVPPQAFDNIIANATIRQTERKPETRSRRERTILQ